MSNTKLNADYFAWMYEYVVDIRLPFKKLFRFLHSIPFTFILPMDGNRYEDGIDLRYRFGYEHNIPYPVIADGLDTNQCSVLE